MAVKIGSKYEEEKSKLIKKIEEKDFQIIKGENISKLCYICRGINKVGKNLLIAYFDKDKDIVKFSVDTFCYHKILGVDSCSDYSQYSN